MCFWALCVCNASGGQKKVSDPSRLELQTVVGHFVGAGNQTRKSSQYSYLLSHLCHTVPHPHRMRIVTGKQATKPVVHYIVSKQDPHWSKQEGCVTGTSPPPKKPKWLLHSGMSGAFSKDLEHSVSAVRWGLWSPQRAARPPQARLYIRLSGVSARGHSCPHVPLLVVCYNAKGNWLQGDCSGITLVPWTDSQKCLFLHKAHSQGLTQQC